MRVGGFSYQQQRNRKPCAPGMRKEDRRYGATPQARGLTARALLMQTGACELRPNSLDAGRVKRVDAADSAATARRPRRAGRTRSALQAPPPRPADHPRRLTYHPAQEPPHAMLFSKFGNQED